MRAIQFSEEAGKIILRYGESAFKKVDEFWFDFKPDGGEKTTSFAANLVPDTEENRLTMDAIVLNSINKKNAMDRFEKEFYSLLNKVKR